MDTPFDEIYHKERKLVSDIVRAMQSIKDIESKLPNPAANRQFDPKDIDEDPVYGDMYSSVHEPQYIRDKKLEEKMNQANLIGRIGNMSEQLSQTSSGTSYCSASLATNDGTKDKPKTNWHNLQFWGKGADLFFDLASKGRLVAVTGRIDYSEYEKDGVKRYSTKIVVDRFQMLDKRPDSDIL